MHELLNDEDKKLSDYWLNLGRFIEAFAVVEQTLLGGLEVMSKTSPQVARALFSGTRTEAAMSYINRILEVTKASKKDREHVQWIFTQLGHINKLRNDVVHFGVKDRGGPDFIVSNKTTALNRSRLRESAVSSTTMKQMTLDLWKIHAHLVAFIYRHAPSMPLWLDLNRDLLDSPWRYKPQTPPSRGRRRLGRLLKRPRPPQSSRA